MIKKRVFLIIFLCVYPLFAADAPLSERLMSSVAEIREEAVAEFNRLPHETQERFIPTFMVGLSSEDPDVHDTSALLLKKLEVTPRPSHPELAEPAVETPVARQTREQESLQEIQQLKTDRYKNLKAELEAEKKVGAQGPSLDEARGHAKSDPIRDALLDGLADPAPFVRSRSARHIGGLNPPMVEAIPALTKMLGDPDAECRGSAAGALGALGPVARDALPQLRTLTGDSDPNVRAVAQEALRQISATEE